jgi:hypothetical protein
MEPYKGFFIHSLNDKGDDAEAWCSTVIAILACADL